MSPQAADRARVEEALGEVFARREFRDEPSLLEEQVGGLFSDLGEGVAATSDVLARLFPVFLVLLFVYVLVRATRQSRLAVRRADAVRGASLDERLAQLLAEARAARDAGERRRALRLYCGALVVGLGARGDLGFREAWTNRELLRRGRPKESARRLLEELVDGLEGKEYGREEITAADLERLEELCAVHLGEPGGGAA